MKHSLLLGASLAMLVAATQARAGDIGFFTVTGEAANGSDIEAQWEGETMAEDVTANGTYTLQIPEGDALPYHPGDELDIVIDGKPTDRTVKLGDPGSTLHLSLLNAHARAPARL